MKVTTTSFEPDGPIDLRYVAKGQGGQNINPQLSWSDAPEGTKSFAVTIYDPDAPTGSGFWHWIVVNIPADVTSIAEGAGAPAGSLQVASDYGKASYGGPQPPVGWLHRYVHTVHALPVERIDCDENSRHVGVRFQIWTKALDSASVTGVYENKG